MKRSNDRSEYIVESD